MSIRAGIADGDTVVGFDWMRLVAGLQLRLMFGRLGGFYLAWWEDRK